MWSFHILGVASSHLLTLTNTVTLELVSANYHGMQNIEVLPLEQLLQHASMLFLHIGYSNMLKIKSKSDLKMVLELLFINEKNKAFA